MTDKTLSYWALKHEIRELKELNKLLQRNMFHYEYRARDEGIRNIKLEIRIEELEKIIADLKQPPAVGEKEE